MPRVKRDGARILAAYPRSASAPGTSAMVSAPTKWADATVWLYPPQRHGRMQPFGCIRPNAMGGCNRLVVSAHFRPKRTCPGFWLVLVVSAPTKWADATVWLYPPHRHGRMQPFGCIRPNDMGGCNRLVVSAHLLNISRGQHSAFAICRIPNSEFYQKPISEFRLPSILTHNFRCRAPPYVLSIPTPPYAMWGTAVLVISSSSIGSSSSPSLYLYINNPPM
jgi:hypothetical protein